MVTFILVFDIRYNQVIFYLLFYFIYVLIIRYFEI